MATIDNLDVNIYMDYANRSQHVEEVQHDFALNQAAKIPPQTLLVNLYPKPSEIDMLMGTLPVVVPWAYFVPPKRLFQQRRSTFSFSRIMPTLGTYEEEEQQEQDLDDTECETELEEKEKAILKRCFAEIKKINGWMNFIIGRVGQFLQA